MLGFTLLHSLIIWFSAYRLTSSIPLDQTVFISSGQEHGLVRGKHAAVACESDICSRVGIALNEAGGNAADMVGLPSCINLFSSHLRLTEPAR